MRVLGCTQRTHSMFLPMHIDEGGCSSLPYIFCWGGAGCVMVETH